MTTETVMPGEVDPATEGSATGSLRGLPATMDNAMAALPEDLQPALLPRRRSQFVATALVSGGAALVVISALGRYLSMRATQRAAGEWPFGTKVTLHLSQPNVQLFTLILACVAIQWAVYSAARDDRGHAGWALGITGVLGIAFVNQTWFLLSQLNFPVETFPIESPLFHTVVIAHLVMVVGSLVYLLFAAIRFLGGQYGSRFPDGLSSVALAWYVTTGVYVAVWYGVYITK